MGLDMYLNANRFYWFNETKPTIEAVPIGFEVESIECRAAYWRKANQIHAWFVQNVCGGEDDCRPHDVSREEMAELRDLCAGLLLRKNKAEAAEKLPPQSGFFFGSTDIDSWYWDDLESTVAQITKALDGFPDGWDFVYRASW